MTNDPVRKMESGYVLLLTLVVMVVLFLFGSALWFYSTAEMIQINHFEKTTKAHYLARSGLDISVEILAQSMFLVEENVKTFYIYGDIDGNSLEFSVHDEDYNGEYDDKEIFVRVELQFNEEDTIEGVITARGRFLDTTEQIIRNFSFDPDWEEGSDYLTTSPPEETADAGPDGLGWYGSDGKMQPGGGSYDSDGKPASLIGNPVIYEDQASGKGGRYFSAPAMYFGDEDGQFGTLEIRQQNAQLRLKTNFLVINGDLIFVEQGNSFGQVLLHVYENTDNPEISNTLYGSSITEEDLGGNAAMEDKKYGVFYIGGAIQVNTSGEINDDVEPGYYYFPEGTDLSSSVDLSTLIKIDDVSSVNLGPLGLTEWFSSDSDSPFNFLSFQ